MRTTLPTTPAFRAPHPTGPVIRPGCWRVAVATALLLAASVPAQAQPADRGRLLYGNHCIECHTTQMHWREQRLARDWNTLRAQVARWQATASLRWSDADIDAVAQHLNDTIYGFPRFQARAPLPGAVAAQGGTPP